MRENNTIRVILVDDHKLFRYGLSSLLRDYNEIYIVEEAENGKEMIEKYTEYKPDVILADLSMPVLTGIEAAKRLKRKDSAVRILFLSMYSSNEYKYMAWKAGGLGLINKNIMMGELIFALKKVFNGEYYFGRQWGEDKMEEMIAKFSKKDKLERNEFQEALTIREEEILSLVGEGYTSPKIASVLGISRRTVETHRSNIMQKLNLHSFPELLKYAMSYVQAENI